MPGMTGRRPPATSPTTSTRRPIRPAVQRRRHHPDPRHQPRPAPSRQQPGHPGPHRRLRQPQGHRRRIQRPHRRHRGHGRLTTKPPPRTPRPRRNTSRRGLLPPRILTANDAAIITLNVRAHRRLRHPVSLVVLGPRGWIQAANFAVAGTLFLAGAAGLARAGDAAASLAAPALIGAAGAGLIGAAVFTTDPVNGYPPGTPDAPTHPTGAGMAHNPAAVPVFAGLPVAALASGRRSWRACAAPLRFVQRRYRRDHAH